MCAAVAAALGMNAQDATPLTAEMWHQWTGMNEETKVWGADVTIIEDAETGCEYNVGKELGQSDMVIGPQSCNGDLFANLSEYDGIEGVATPGITMRFYLNRLDLQGGGEDIKIDTDADGKYLFKFSDLKDAKFIHLNFIKIAAAWQGGKWPEGLEKAVVESVNLIPKGTLDEPVTPDDPVTPADPLAITGSWFHEWSDYGADAEVSKENPEGIEDQIGKEVGGGATILGSGAVPGSIYADLTQYVGIEAEGTPGVGLRLLFNRPSMEGGSAPITECFIEFDENGKFTFLFTELTKQEGENAYPYVHLNAVKTPWGLPEGVSSCKVTKFNAIPKTPTAVNAIENAESNNVIYNIYGQRVDESYRGIVIKNGKKFIQK